MHLAPVVVAVFGKDVGDLRLLYGTEHQRLSVMSRPVVQIPHAHTREINTVRIQRLQIQMLQHMLQHTQRIMENEVKPKAHLTANIKYIYIYIITH